MVIKPNKILCCRFLFAFSASTVHKNTIVVLLRTEELRIKRDFLKHKTIKVRDNKLNRRFGVDITPLSR